MWHASKSQGRKCKRLVLVGLLFRDQATSILSNTVVNAFSLPFNSESHLNEDIIVWDDVLTDSNREVLHSAASASGLGHKVFTRPLVDPDHSGIIERTLDSILTEMGDAANETNTQYVEYWTRQEWRHIEAHADVDENLAKEQDMSGSVGDGYRYPVNGHVLYLKVGSEVQGPTCIFPGRSTGGDLVEKSADSEAVEVVTVPAVSGRLLRFEGSFLHCVPRPADLWFLSFVKGAPKFSPEDKYMRSVILFNTWDGNGPPPKDVPLDDKNTCVEVYENSLCKNHLDWNLAFTATTTQIIDGRVQQEKIGKPAKIWLLGNERRRNNSMRTIKLAAHENTRDAFLERSTVSKFKLFQ